jgi:hypothetical protein
MSPLSEMHEKKILLSGRRDREPDEQPAASIVPAPLEANG